MPIIYSNDNFYKNHFFFLYFSYNFFFFPFLSCFYRFFNFFYFFLKSKNFKIFTFKKKIKRTKTSNFFFNFSNKTNFYLKNIIKKHSFRSVTFFNKYVNFSKFNILNVKPIFFYKILFFLRKGSVDFVSPIYFKNYYKFPLIKKINFSKLSRRKNKIKKWKLKKIFFYFKNEKKKLNYTFLKKISFLFFIFNKKFSQKKKLNYLKIKNLTNTYFNNKFILMSPIKYFFLKKNTLYRLNKFKFTKKKKIRFNKFKWKKKNNFLIKNNNSRLLNKSSKYFFSKFNTINFVFTNFYFKTSISSTNDANLLKKTQYSIIFFSQNYNLKRNKKNFYLNYRFYKKKLKKLKRKKNLRFRFKPKLRFKFYKKKLKKLKRKKNLLFVKFNKKFFFLKNILKITKLSKKNYLNVRSPFFFEKNFYYRYINSKFSIFFKNSFFLKKKKNNFFKLIFQSKTRFRFFRKIFKILINFKKFFKKPRRFRPFFYRRKIKHFFFKNMIKTYILKKKILLKKKKFFFLKNFFKLECLKNNLSNSSKLKFIDNFIPFVFLKKLKITNAFLYLLNKKNITILPKLRSKVRFFFIHSLNGFLYLDFLNSFFFFRKKNVWLIRKILYSFISKNDLQNFLLKKYVKHGYRSMSNRNKNNRLIFQNLQPFVFKNKILDSEIENKDFFFEYNSFSFKNLYLFSSLKNFTSLFTFHFESIDWVDSLLETTQFNSLKNIDNGFSIKKIKFKPGYQTMWRNYRSTLKMLLNLKFKYQHQLTKYLSKFTKLVRHRIYFFFEMQLENLLTSSKFCPDRIWSSHFIKEGLVFINGLRVFNAAEQLFKNDFVQLALSIKYYLLYRWLLNWHVFNKIKFKNRINRKLNSKNLPDDKQKSKNLPLWLFKTKNINEDVSKYIETDYFSLSFFILYEPLFFTDINPVSFIGIRYNIINLYNWKYIN